MAELAMLLLNLLYIVFALLAVALVTTVLSQESGDGASGEETSNTPKFTATVAGLLMLTAFAITFLNAQAGEITPFQAL